MQRPIHLGAPKTSLISKHVVFGYALQACKPRACPVSRPKKGPGDSNRDINGLLNRGSYTTRPGVIPHRMWPTGQSSSLREKEAPIWRVNGHQVTRELLGTKPYN